MTNDTPLDMLQIKIERAKESLSKETLKAIASVDWRAYILGMREKKGYSFEQLEDLELETELLLCGLLNPVDYPKELEERLKLPRPQVDLLVNEMNEFVFKKIKDELIKNSERREMFVKREEKSINEQLRITNYELKEKTNTSNVIATDKHVSSPNVINIKDSPVLNKKTDIEIMSADSPARTVLADRPEELPAGSAISTTLAGRPKNEVINKSETKVLEKAGIEIAPTIKDVGVSTESVGKSISSQKLSGSFQIPTIKTEYSLDNLSKQGETTTPINDKLRNSKDPYREIPE